MLLAVAPCSRRTRCRLTAAWRIDRMEALKKRKEVFGSRAKFPEEDLQKALCVGKNEVDAAVRALQSMKRCEDNLVSKRGGHATRAQVRYALKVCDINEQDAEYLLVNEKDMVRQVTFITDRLGRETGLGHPTLAELQFMLVKEGGSEGGVMASLKRSNRQDIAMMDDVIAAAEVPLLPLFTHNTTQHNPPTPLQSTHPQPTHPLA